MGEGFQNHPSLAAELIDHIIGQIDSQTEDGRKALISCSTASSVLLPFAQKRIFNSISVTLRVGLYEDVAVFFEDSKTTGKKLLDILDHSPHLALYIQNLTIVFYESGFLPRLSRHDISNTITSYSPLFPLYAIVRKLVKLRFFKIRGHVSWRQLEQTIRDFMHELVRTHDLEELDLVRIDGVPSTLFSGCETLRALHLSNFEIKMDQEPSEQVDLDFLRYRETLSLSQEDANMLKMFDSPFSPLSFRHLRKLVVVLTDPSAVCGLLSFCSDTLESLEMWSFGFWRDNSSMEFKLQNTVPVFRRALPDLGGLHRLRDVVIFSKITTYRDRECFRTDVPYACAILGSIPIHSGIPASIDATLLIICKNVSPDNLQDIQWSELIGANLAESRIRSAGIKLEVLFSISEPEFEEFSEQDLVPVLERNEYLTRLKELGLAIYGTWEPLYSLPPLLL